MPPPPPYKRTITPPPNDSLINSFLPNVVSSRLPRLPSLRKTLSNNALGDRFRAPAPAMTHRRTSTLSTSAPTTPPEMEGEFLSMRSCGDSKGALAPDTPRRLGKAIVLADEGRDREGRWDSPEETDWADEGNDTSRRPMMRYPAEKQMQPAVYHPPAEKQSGVSWTYVAPALQLLQLAATQSKTLEGPTDVARRDDRDSGAVVVRNLYLDATRYLLRGLPADLSPEEARSLECALPPSFTPPAAIQGPQSSGAADASSPPTETAPKPPPTFLHSVLTHSIVLLITFAHTMFTIFLPFLRTTLTWLYKFEKEHKVFEWAVVTGSRVGVKVSKEAAAGVMGMVVAVFGSEALGWVLQTVSEGVNEGVREGLKGVKSQ
jgi:hypothetical protein